MLAAVVKLLETTLIRVGNDEYARDNNSFGMTTMHDEHVAIRGAALRFDFRGKHGIEHEYYVGGNGAHDWGTWRHLLHEKFLPGLWRAR